jgi:hypothetical protein
MLSKRAYFTNEQMNKLSYLLVKRVNQGSDMLNPLVGSLLSYLATTVFLGIISSSLAHSIY